MLGSINVYNILVEEISWKKFASKKRRLDLKRTPKWKLGKLNVKVEFNST
jgi:hypothetical protein